MNLLQQVSSSTLVLGLSYVSRFLLTLILARYLNSDELGIYSWVVTVFGFLLIFTNFGSDFFLLRKVPELKTSNVNLMGAVIRHTQRTVSINAFLLITIIYTISIMLVQFKSGVLHYISELAIISLALPLSAYSMIFTTSLRGYNFALAAQIIESILQTGFLLVVVFLMFYFFGDRISTERRTISLVITFVVSWFVSFSGALYYYRRKIKVPKIIVPTKTKVREWRREQSTILFGIVGWTILGRSDIFLLAFLVPPSQVGAYFLCLRLAELLMFFSTVSFNVWSGKLSNLIHNGDHAQAQSIIKKAAQLCTVTTAVIALIALLNSHYILLFFNETYTENKLIFQIAVCVFFIKGSSGLLRPLFYLLQDQKYMAKYNWLMGIAFTMMLFILVPNFGIVGSVTAFAICESTFILILALRMQKKFNFSILPF